MIEIYVVNKSTGDLFNDNIIVKLSVINAKVIFI